MITLNMVKKRTAIALAVWWVIWFIYTFVIGGMTFIQYLISPSLVCENNSFVFISLYFMAVIFGFLGLITLTILHLLGRLVHKSWFGR